MMFRKLRRLGNITRVLWLVDALIEDMRDGHVYLTNGGDVFDLIMESLSTLPVSLNTRAEIEMFRRQLVYITAICVLAYSDMQEDHDEGF